MKKKIIAVCLAACACGCAFALSACGGNDKPDTSHDIISTSDWDAAFVAAFESNRYMWVKVTPVDTDSVLTAQKTKTETFGQNTYDWRFMYTVESENSVAEHWYYEIGGAYYDHVRGEQPSELTEDEFATITADGKFEPFLFDVARIRFGLFSYSAHGGSGEQAQNAAYVRYSAKTVPVNVDNDAQPISGSADIEVTFAQKDKSLLSISAVITDSGKTYRYELRDIGTWDIPGFDDVVQNPDGAEDAE